MPSFGPEWNPVLVVLAVLAFLCGAAMIAWWAGVIALAAVLIVLAVEA